MSKVRLFVHYQDALGRPATWEDRICASLLPSRADKMSIVEASGQRREHTVRDRTFRILTVSGDPEPTVSIFLDPVQ